MQSVASALGAPSPPSSGRRTPIAKRQTPAPTRKNGAKRSPDELNALTTALLRYVRQNPGQRIEQIAQGLEIATKELKLPAIKLIDDEQISTKGQKRATTYFPK